ncbi:MAG TPA: glycosyltransferase family 9 protein [Gammaproteobacteria bacterium]|nr:glycosyltransferase family 9 protein [Gammaproteobacteria bacterium]
MREPRIAVVRALHGLGDMLCAVPALRALRSSYGRAHISLIGLPEVEWFAERFSDCIDELVPFPGFPGIPERPYSRAALARFLRDVEASPFDVAIQMHGAGTVSNAFTALIGARSVAGLYRHGEFCPAPETFFRYPERGSEIRRWLHLTESLGCSSSGDAIVFPIREADREALEANPRLASLEPGGCVLIHAGARDLLRRWPSACFARVADAFAAKGYRIVLTGTRAERRTAETVAALMRHDALDVAGETDLGAAAALLERAVLLVTNDTGMSHLAAAVGTPSVVVFLASDVDRWAPLDRRRHRPVVARGLARQDIGEAYVSRGDVPAPDEVLEQAEPLLNIEAVHG